MNDSLSYQPRNPQSSTDTQLVKIDPPLLCYTPYCGALASLALAVRDPLIDGAWRLLPLCLTCVRALLATSH